MVVPDQLYTVNSLLTLGGSATAVWVITSVIGYLFNNLNNKNIQTLQKWLGFALSLVFALLGAFLLKPEERTVFTWIVAIVNGFLIYLTAIGESALTNNIDRRGDSRTIIPTSASNHGKFFKSWF
jgi:uncharacterized membrane protein YfcA